MPQCTRLCKNAYWASRRLPRCTELSGSGDEHPSTKPVLEKAAKAPLGITAGQINPGYHSACQPDLTLDDWAGDRWAVVADAPECTSAVLPARVFPAAFPACRIRQHDFAHDICGGKQLPYLHPVERERESLAIDQFLMLDIRSGCYLGARGNIREGCRT